jgi:hypothetical protein
MSEMEKTNKILVGTPEREDLLEDLRVDRI